MNVGHLDSYVPFDLQLSARVHFQVRSAEGDEGEGVAGGEEEVVKKKKTFSDTFSLLLVPRDFI